MPQCVTADPTADLVRRKRHAPKTQALLLYSSPMTPQALKLLEALEMLSGPHFSGFMFAMCLVRQCYIRSLHSEDIEQEVSEARELRHRPGSAYRYASRD